MEADDAFLKIVGYSRKGLLRVASVGEIDSLGMA